MVQMVCTIHRWFRWIVPYTDGEKKLFLKKKFVPYTDGLDGLHHTQMTTKKIDFFAVEHCLPRLVLDLAPASTSR